MTNFADGFVDKESIGRLTEIEACNERLRVNHPLATLPESHVCGDRMLNDNKILYCT